MVKTPACHAGIVGSNPARVTFGGLAQLGEHLPYKQGVTGSSPVGPIVTERLHAGVAELADALDLGSSVFMTWGFKSLHPHHL